MVHHVLPDLAFLGRHFLHGRAAIFHLTRLDKFHAQANLLAQLGDVRKCGIDADGTAVDGLYSEAAQCLKLTFAEIGLKTLSEVMTELELVRLAKATGAEDRSNQQPAVETPENAIKTDNAQVARFLRCANRVGLIKSLEPDELSFQCQIDYRHWRLI